MWLLLLLISRLNKVICRNVLCESVGWLVVVRIVLMMWVLKWWFVVLWCLYLRLVGRLVVCVKFFWCWWWINLFLKWWLKCWMSRILWLLILFVIEVLIEKLYWVVINVRKVLFWVLCWWFGLGSLRIWVVGVLLFFLGIVNFLLGVVVSEIFGLMFVIGDGLCNLLGSGFLVVSCFIRLVNILLLIGL